ncbi:MAG: peptidoglycan-binding domain-containing protein [Dermatophilaceae bacterium]
MSVRARVVTLSGAALAVPLMAIGLASTARADTTPVTPVSPPTPAPVPVVPAAPTKTLPVALDIRTPYEPQLSCDPRDKPGVAAFAALMKASYKTGTTGISRSCTAATSEHYEGRALDWMLSAKDPQQKAVADSVVAWLSADSGAVARRFGISYIVWNTKMWREYAPERGWVAYTGSVPHTDHIHLSFSWDGAMARTPWWTGRATTVVDLGTCRMYAGQYAPLYAVPRTAACPTNLPVAPASPYPVYVIGQRNAQIAVAQRALGVTADEQFGPATFAALVSWQTRAGVPITGVLDKSTWAKLVPTPPAPPVTRPPVTRPPVTRPPVTRPPVTTTPVPIPAPIPAPAPAPKPASAMAPVRPVFKAPPAPVASTRYTAYKGVVLRQGSKGSAVVALQRALKVTPDGDFGPRTRSALATFQRLQRISPNGVADRLVWDRLEKRDYPLVGYRGLTLKPGSKGVSVVALQRALRVTPDGAFGPITQAAVKAVQSRAKLAPTGVVSGVTWIAIESQIRR